MTAFIKLGRNFLKSEEKENWETLIFYFLLENYIIFVYPRLLHTNFRLFFKTLLTCQES